MLTAIRPRAFFTAFGGRALFFVSYRKEHHNATKLVSKRVGGLGMGMEMWAFDSEISLVVS